MIIDYKKKISDLRKSLGITQVQLSEKTGIAQSSLARLESNPSYGVSLDVFQRYIDGLGHHLEIVPDDGATGTEETDPTSESNKKSSQNDWTTGARPTAGSAHTVEDAPKCEGLAVGRPFTIITDDVDGMTTRQPDNPAYYPSHHPDR